MVRKRLLYILLLVTAFGIRPLSAQRRGSGHQRTTPPAPLKLKPMGSPILCAGSVATIGSDALGGVPPYNYLWTPATWLDDPTQATPTTSASSTITYHITVTDQVGNTDRDSVTVTVTEPVHPKITSSKLSVICENDSATLSIDSGFSTYLWSTGEATLKVKVSNGTYWVNTTDKNGCASQDTIIIPRIKPQISIVGPVSVCP